MSDASGFPNLVPGFDFLQSLVKNAGAALPGIGQWVAPTLNPEELEKRISELRTVQFWLEQNGRMIGATIQALEVQRMTLSTLKTMNVQMGDLQESMKIRMPTAPAAAAATPTMPGMPTMASMAAMWPSAAAATPAPAPAAAPAAPAAEPAAAAAATPGVVDPMQWWGALTKQFAELATTAMKDTGGDAARTMAESMVKQTLDSAGQAVKTVTDAAAAATSAATSATKPPKPAKAAAADSTAKATSPAPRKPAAPRG